MTIQLLRASSSDINESPLSAATYPHHHQTDFKGGFSNVKFHTVSLEQMTALTPEMVATKLRILASLVFGMLGAMIVWSAAMHVQDNIGRREMLTALMRGSGKDSVGFRALDDGVWVWALPPIATEADTGALWGACVATGRCLPAASKRFQRAVLRVTYLCFRKH